MSKQCKTLKKKSIMPRLLFLKKKKKRAISEDKLVHYRTFKLIQNMKHLPV